MVDARDLKSLGWKRPCRFDSGSGHHIFLKYATAALNLQTLNGNYNYKNNAQVYSMGLSYGSGTDIGNLSDHNEDSYFADPELGLWLVADGMGGHAAGEVASAIVRDVVSASISQGKGLQRSIQLAHERIHYAGEIGHGSPGMGSTIVALLSQAEQYRIAWVGDSRAYLWDNGSLRQLTHDHSFVQRLVDGGAISAEEAITHPNRNIILHSVGAMDAADAYVDEISGYWLKGQKILLCSDGLSDDVSDRELIETFQRDTSDQEIVDRLIARALENGGGDNITALVISAPSDALTAEEALNAATQKIRLSHSIGQIFHLQERSIFWLTSLLTVAMIFLLLWFVFVADR